jgi:hypothetical protein
MGCHLRKDGRSMKRVRTGKGGIKETGMRICIWKGEGGLVILRWDSIPLKGLNVRALFMMLVPLSLLMVSLMDLLVCLVFF